MEVRDARLALTTVDPTDQPAPPLPEIAFVGRSNVGKSSLLNTLVRRRKLARISRTPGKTQTLNYYAIGTACYFVDLPGYGYAAVPEGVRRQWAPMIESYLGSSDRLAAVVALVDGRREPTDLDAGMVAWLADRGLPVLVVLTKSDRVPRGKRDSGAAVAADRLGLDLDQVVWFSARTGEGRDEILSALGRLLKGENLR